MNLRSSHLRGLVLAAGLALASPGALAFPIITDVVETGGDNEVTDTIVAKWTGVTWNATVAGEPVPGIPVGTPYTVPLFGEGVPCYVDRAHSWKGASGGLPLPTYLVGGEYLMCSNDNRDNASYRLDISVAEDALVYLLIDNRRGDAQAANPPFYSAGPEPEYWSAMTWVATEGFVAVKTGANRTANPDYPDEVGVDENTDGSINNWSSVYFKSVTAGTFSVYEYGEGSRNMYGVVVKPLPTSVSNPPVLSDVKPANNSLFYDASAGLSFKATTISPNRLEPANIKLTLNGADVSSKLAITGNLTNRSVQYTGLKADVMYSAHLSVADQAGRTTQLDLSFDTFSPTTAVVLEAEDYNYESGKTLAAPPPAGYAGLMGTTEVDYHDNNSTTAASNYRPADFAGADVSSDAARPRFTSAGATDYDVTGFIEGDWMNYTVTLPNKSYRVYLRAAAGRAQTVRLDRVTGDAASPSQGWSALGFFELAGSAYGYKPLTDAAGNQVSLALSDLTTLRLTACFSSSPGTRLNFLVLVPDTGVFLPFVSEAVPGKNAVDVPLDAVVRATIVNGTTQVLPAKVTLTFNGSDVTAAASVTATADGVQVAYDPPGSLALNTVYPVRLAFTDGGGASFSHDWTFTTRPFAPLILNVVESGGDDSENTPPKWTRETFSHPNLGTMTVGTFREDVPAYRDRTHQWNGASAILPLPAYLLGGDYILERNDNRDNVPFQLDITLAEPALVYLLVDNRLSDGDGNTPPDFSTGLMSWLATEGWLPVQTSWNRLLSSRFPDEIGVDESGNGTGPGAGIDNYSSVYVKEFPAGTFSIYQADNSGRNMYGVVARAVATHLFAPSVAITSPTNETALTTVPATVNITANASVRNSAITKVEFYEAVAGKIGEDTAAPYALVWKDVLSGRYRLTAKATAANGQSMVSEPVEIIIGSVISVNFQTATAEVFNGYLADFGDVFGDRGNGYSYGWDADNTANARERLSALSPDKRFDTLNHLQKALPAGRFWEIEVPNGWYNVHAVTGDADNYDSVYDLLAEGVTVVKGIPTSTTRWYEGAALVQVQDGRLTVSNGPTAQNNKVAFLDLGRLPASPPPAKFAPATLAGGLLTITWAGLGRLQEAPEVVGPWTDVPGNPAGTYSTPAAQARRFYRTVFP